MKGNFLFIAIYVFSKEKLAEKVEQTIAVSISWYVYSPSSPEKLNSSTCLFILETLLTRTVQLHDRKLRLRPARAPGSNAETRLADPNNIHPSALHPRRSTRRAVQR
jgi:hypothetical protein